ncbi:hypothetical protein [Stakelama tenebrarum]|uniref:AbiJ N-terminal domain-containing protein n=1 Tax=Stakelama tenebrarum TaxID=2711215 RepID=A0A6G6Y797_9SPHN|nr:hypothetical protein [Sphingosinithalassobacter tenebrarum]QIG80667.1 hypothetical protein G5C33_13345 [Sphingosinithalassobacter tenebrarum]
MFPPPLSDSDRKRLIALTRIAVTNFNSGDWQILGAETGAMDVVTGHDRLLRSLSFGDPDYSGNAHAVMFQIVGRDPANLQRIEDVIIGMYGEPEVAGENVSTAPSKSRAITFKPSVFDVPEGGVETDLVAVMMPFSADFEGVYEAISAAGTKSGFRTLRAKDIWLHSAVIQDVFSLIFRAHIVVCDFTGKNPNVFYEAGIAHTLGKHVVPITQTQADIPFDLQHHRYLQYLNNGEGKASLCNTLATRFSSLR